MGLNICRFRLFDVVSNLTQICLDTQLITSFARHFLHWLTFKLEDQKNFCRSFFGNVYNCNATLEPVFQTPHSQSAPFGLCGYLIYLAIATLSLRLSLTRKSSKTAPLCVLQGEHKPTRFCCWLKRNVQKHSLRYKIKRSNVTRIKPFLGFTEVKTNVLAYLI